MTDLLEVHAIVRTEMLDRVIHALREAGVSRLTVSRVHAIGAGVDPGAARFSVEESVEYADKASVQLVCASEQSGALVQAICRAARTGRGGDGIVYLLPVASVTKIRTGITGSAAIQ